MASTRRETAYRRTGPAAMRRRLSSYPKEWLQAQSYETELVATAGTDFDVPLQIFRQDLYNLARRLTTEAAVAGETEGWLVHTEKLDEDNLAFWFERAPIHECPSVRGPSAKARSVLGQEGPIYGGPRNADGSPLFCLLPDGATPSPPAHTPGSLPGCGVCDQAALAASDPSAVFRTEGATV